MHFTPMASFWGDHDTPLSAIQSLFSSVSSSYDRMNDVLSGGCHHLWKFSFVQHMAWDQLPQTMVHVDMACGTGDIGHMVMHRNATRLKKNITSVFIDPTPDMIQSAKQRLTCPSITWRCEDAEHSTVPSASVHLYTIAFGLRNVHNRQQALTNAVRMLAPGGQLWCLDFSWPHHPIMATLYDGYLGLLPAIGHHVANNGPAYAYLANSIRSFPIPSVLCQDMHDAGLVNTGIRPLSNGIVSVVWGTKA